MNAGIEKKYIIKATLKNLSPLLIGGGEVDLARDVAFVKDHEGRPYIPGTSLAGSLKKYFEERYDISNAIDILWGQDDKYQAHLIIDDAYMENNDYTLTIRDSVKIDNETGRAVDNGLYNYETLDPGARFTFNGEITVRNGMEDPTLKFLKTFYEEFENGSSQMGALSSFGFGKMKFENIRVAEISEVSEWIRFLQEPDKIVYDWNPKSIDSYIRKSANFLDIELHLRQASAFIARDYSQELTDEISRILRSISSQSEDASPDSVTLLVDDQPVLTGKTLKGALRAQAATIINTIKSLNEDNYSPQKNPDKILDELFGKWIEEPGDEKKKSKSLLQISETPISNMKNIQLHQRVKIDRFTGGAMDGALFNSVPVYPDPEDKEITVIMRLKISGSEEKGELPKSTKAHLGLLIYILRDLDDKLFSVGGEKAIGRGLFDVNRLKVYRGDKEFANLDFQNLKAEYKKFKSWIEAFHEKLNLEK